MRQPLASIALLTLCLLVLGVSGFATAAQPLEEAARLVELIDNDDDARNENRFRVASALVEAGRLDEAARIGELLGGAYQQGELFSMLGLEALLAGDTEKEQRWMERAAKVAAQYGDQWQADRIHARVGVRRYLIGQKDEAERIVGKFKDMESRLVYQVELAVAQARQTGEDRLELPVEIREGHDKPLPEYLLFTRGATRIAETIFAKNPEAGITDPIRAVLKKGFDAGAAARVVRVKEMLGIGRFFVTHGDTHDAADALKDALGQLSRMQPIAAEKPRMLAQLAAIYARAGDKKSAGRAVADAESCWSKLRPLEQPPALGAIAIGYLELSDTAKSDALFAEAIRIAKANPNRRAGIINAVDLCLDLQAAGKNLPETLGAALNSMRARATGADPGS